MSPETENDLLKPASEPRTNLSGREKECVNALRHAAGAFEALATAIETLDSTRRSGVLNRQSLRSITLSCVAGGRAASQTLVALLAVVALLLLAGCSACADPTGAPLPGDEASASPLARPAPACVQQIHCELGQHFDPAACTCVADCLNVYLCPHGETFDPSACGCVPDADGGSTLARPEHERRVTP